MRAKTLLFVILMIAANAILLAQYTTVDFEPAGLGAGWNWVVGENGANPPLLFPANPVSGGINTSPNVALFTALDAGMDWALCFTDDIDTFQFDASNAIVKIMVYKPVLSNVAVKFEGSSAPIELQVANTVINQWQELTFDFTGSIGNTYSRIVIIPDFAPRDQDNLIYFDNIRIPTGNVTPPPVPTVAAPTPTENPANVISMFSDAYTNVPVDTWLTPWSQGYLEDILVAGNPVKKYTMVNYVGIETVGPNMIDVSGMSHVHVDLWTPDVNDFRFKLVDWGADGSWSGGDDTEHEITYPAPVTGEWISYDIPLSAFTNLAITGHMAQYILSKSPTGTMYIDNLYFYSAAPDIPANVTVVVSPFAVTVSWAAVPGATSYTVYSSSDPFGTYTPATGGTYNGTSWTSPGTVSAMFYYVTANN